MLDIPDSVDNINGIVNDFCIDNLVDINKIPQITVKERLDKYICAVDEGGNVAYYAKLPNTAKNKKIGGNWMATFQESLKWMAQQDLTGEQWKVFAAMCSRMDFDNYIRISQTDLAKELQTNQGNISRSIKKLMSLDIIAEGPRAGLNKTYMLNPNIGIKGKHRKQKIIDYKEAKAELSSKRRDHDNAGS